MSNRFASIVTEYDGHAYIPSWEIAKAYDIRHEEVVKAVDRVVKTDSNWEEFDHRDIYHLDQKTKRLDHGYLIRRELFRLISSDFVVPRTRENTAFKRITSAFNDVEHRLRPRNYEKCLKDYVDDVEQKDKLRELTAENERLKQENETLKPKGVYVDALIATGRCIQIGELAKMMRNSGLNMSAGNLMWQLRLDGYLDHVENGDYYIPSVFCALHGLMKVKEKIDVTRDYETVVKRTVLITVEGQQFFLNHYMHEKERGHI